MQAELPQLHDDDDSGLMAENVSEKVRGSEVVPACSTRKITRISNDSLRLRHSAYYDGMIRASEDKGPEASCSGTNSSAGVEATGPAEGE